MTQQPSRLTYIPADQFLDIRRQIEAIAPPQPREVVDDYTPDDVCIDLIKSGDSYHDPTIRLAWREYTADQIREIYDQSVDKGSKRWRERYDEIDAQVASAAKKKSEQVNAFFGKPASIQRNAPAGSPPQPATFETVSADSFDGQPIPRQRWLIEGMIPAGQPSLLSGDGGLGKSLLAMQLSVSVVATGMWLSRTIERGPALYVSCEDEMAEIHRRLEKIANHAGVTLNDLKNLHIAPMANRDALLASSGRQGLIMTPLYTALAERVESLRPTLVILDSLADVFGGNEIDRAQARWFVGQLRTLCHSTGATIVILAHPSLSGMASGSGLSGSTHWNNSVRSRLYLTRPESGGNDERVLEVKKNNRGETGAKIDLEWKDGVFVAFDGGDAKRFVDANAEAVFMTLLKRYNKQDRFVNASSGQTYAPSRFAEEPEAIAQRFKRRQMRDAMNRLLASGKIENAERRVDGKIRHYLRIAGGA